MPLERFDRGLNDEGQEGKACPPAVRKGSLLSVSKLRDGSHVDLDDRGGMGGGMLAPYHALGDRATHRGEWDNFLSCPRGDDCFTLVKVGPEVLLGQAASPAGPWDLLEIRRREAVPFGKLEDGRRMPGRRLFNDAH